MGANKFEIIGSSTVKTLEEFYSLKDSNKNKFKKIVLLADEVISTGENKIKFENEEFEEVSFSKKTIKGVKFINCKFNSCLFIMTVFENCTFMNCTFKNCNTYGSKWIGNTSIDPKAFSKNFDYKDDANIAVKLFMELMKLYEENHQFDRKKDAKYLYLKSKNGLSYYNYKQEYIGFFKYVWSKFSSKFLDILSGYGVYKYRLLYFLSFYLLVISMINYFLQGLIFEFKDNHIPTFNELVKNFTVINDYNGVPYDILDLLYFSFITITTIGYGDIKPATSIGQFVIIFEGSIGIMLIALSLNMFTNGK